MANEVSVPEAEKYERPIVTVDVVLLTLGEGGLKALLMRRATQPFEGCWALPGGFIHTDRDQSLEDAARRILRDKAGVESPYLEQLQAFGGPARDPRGWTASFAYYALISATSLALHAGANASELAWHTVTDDQMKSALAFDHGRIVDAAVARLRSKVEYSSLPVHLLPELFTLPDLQRLYERILDRRLDKSAFRKRIAEADFLEAVEGRKRLASNRPAQFYRIKPGHEMIFFDRTN
jgi:8-oxo-dGTP diphosphatase